MHKISQILENMEFMSPNLQLPKYKQFNKQI